jgi:Flp pilus assembly pilin Flp
MFSATLNKFHTPGLIGKRQKGVTMIEYALIAGLISVFLITALTATQGALVNIWGAITTALAAAV